MAFCVRGAAARFYLCLLRVAFRLCVWHFLFLFLVFVLSSLFLVFVRLLSFACFLVSFFCFSDIYNIINNYLLCRLCVRMCARTRTMEQGTKKGVPKKALPLFSKKICSKCRIRFGLASIRLPRWLRRRGGALPRQFRRR